MIPLNDDELNALLGQAKQESQEAGRELAARTLRAYEACMVRRTSWYGYFLRPVSVPWPVGVWLRFSSCLSGR